MFNISKTIDLIKHDDEARKEIIAFNDALCSPHMNSLTAPDYAVVVARWLADIE